MKPKTPNDQLVHSQLVEHYANSFNSFLLMRMLVHMYEASNPAEFETAVDRMLDDFKKENLMHIAERIKRQASPEIDLERVRVVHRDAMVDFTGSCKSYLMTLRKGGNQEKAQ